MNGQPVEPEEIAVILEALNSKPLTKGRLSVLTGISCRHVERVICHIRANSIALISSNGDGYFLPATLTEAEENIERRYQRALNQLGTVGGERTLVRRMREAAEPRPTLWPAGAVA